VKDTILAGNPSIDERENRSKLVSCFQNAFGEKPENRPLDDVLQAIRLGEYAALVASIRDTFQQIWNQTKDAHEAKKAIASPKKQLPAFCISGTAISRTEALDHSGFLQIDLDGLNESLPVFREKLKQDPYVAFGFVSPSGAGLKLGMKIDGNRHEDSFAAAEAYFKDRYGLQIDSRCKDLLRLCFVSHDPELWTNWAAIPLPITPTPLDIRLKSVSESCDLHLDSASCITSTPILKRIKDRNEAVSQLNRRRAGLDELYEQLVESRIEARPAERNNSIVQLIPFLFRAVAPNLVLAFVRCYYESNQTLFNDPIKTHMEEAKSMLDAVNTSYLESLTAIERPIYMELTEELRNVFRICRDLASLPEPKRDFLTFYLSFNQLGLRVELNSMQTQRLMRKLESFGIIHLVQKGTKRAPGIKGQAGIYRWLLTSSPNNQSAL
jgi:hypothetical protein